MNNQFLVAGLAMYQISRKIGVGGQQVLGKKKKTPSPLSFSMICSVYEPK